MLLFKFISDMLTWFGWFNLVLDFYLTPVLRKVLSSTGSLDFFSHNHSLQERGKIMHERRAFQSMSSDSTFKYLHQKKVQPLLIRGNPIEEPM